MTVSLRKADLLARFSLEVMKYPPYSSDLARLDFHLSSKLKKELAETAAYRYLRLWRGLLFCLKFKISQKQYQIVFRKWKI